MICVGLALHLSVASRADAQFVKEFTPPATSAPTTPDLEALRATARTTARNLERFAASWSVRTHNYSTGAELVVDVLRTPAATRYIYRYRDNVVRHIELARVIETADAWYVTDANGLRMCRPYECEFRHPACSMLHELARLRFVTSDDPGQPLRFTERKGSRLTYYAPPLNPGILRYRLAESENAARLDPARAAADSAWKNYIALLKKTIAEGVPLTIDADTGLISSFYSENYHTDVFDFTFLDRVNDADLEPAGRPWRDLTTALPLDHPDDLVMIDRNARSAPAGVDCLILNVATGQARRLPFRGCKASPGCYNKERTRVFVPAYEYLSGQRNLWEIDLKTGENRRVSGMMECNFVETPTLSPDGRTVAVVNKRDPSDLSENEIVLLDVASGAVRHVRQPFHVGRIQWHPDGVSLLATKSSMVDRKPDVDVGRLVLEDASFTKICDRGDHVYLPDRRSILAARLQTNAWSLCDLDGQNITQFGNGMVDYFGPTVSPDGKRLLMVYGKIRSAAQLVTVDPNTLRVTPLSVESGGWADPSW
jgi:hypothetical protein